jgi:hypothetical protein
MESLSIPAITPEFIQANHNTKPWEWSSGGLSQNPAITPEFIQSNPDIWKWGHEGLSSNRMYKRIFALIKRVYLF